MKKTMTRIAACSLAVLIAFNTFAIPKSKAVLLESIGWSCAVSAGLASFGITMDAACNSAVDVAKDVREWHNEKIMPIWEQYEKEVNMVFDYASLIAEGVSFSNTKQVQFTGGLWEVLADFGVWFVNKFNIDGAISSTAVYPDMVLYPELPVYSIPSIEEVWKRWVLTYDPETFIFTYYCVEEEGGHSYTIIDGIPQLTLQSRYGNFWRWICSPGGTDEALKTWQLDVDFNDRGYRSYNIPISTIVFSTFDVRTGSDGPVVVPATDKSLWGGVAGYTSDVVVLPPSQPISIPQPESGKGIVIGLPQGQNITTWSDYADYVAQKDKDDVYIPESVAIGDIDTSVGGDVVVPDEDTQAGILSWVKTIAQRVSALPQSIAEAVKSIFVPDVALTTEITDTFSEKFAFVPQLHALGTDLLNMGPDSGPPVIYIHLEDAEGTIDYGGTVKALDMSWYERYKEDGDRIIGGFLWLGFLWALFMRVSDIINGAGMAYVLGQPTIYTPEPPNDAPRLEGSRKRGKR